jgi:hypothetical protein
MEHIGDAMRQVREIARLFGGAQNFSQVRKIFPQRFRGLAAPGANGASHMQAACQELSARNCSAFSLGIEIAD